MEQQEKVKDSPKSIEEKIIDYLHVRENNQFIKMNDFLKSLFGTPPVQNMPPEWTKQSVSKKIRNILDKMQENGKITINGDQYKKLGTHYYEGNNPITQYHSLKNIIIEAKI